MIRGDPRGISPLRQDGRASVSSTTCLLSPLLSSAAGVFMGLLCDRLEETTRFHTLARECRESQRGGVRMIQCRASAHTRERARAREYEADRGRIPRGKHPSATRGCLERGQGHKKIPVE